jgi:hypothetical protein
MILLWCIVSASSIVALVAWSQARRTARQLAQLSEMYWELRYQYGELRAQLQRPTVPVEPSMPSAEAPMSGSVRESFVPLSTLKR